MKFVMNIDDDPEIRGLFEALIKERDFIKEQHEQSVKFIEKLREDFGKTKDKFWDDAEKRLKTLGKLENKEKHFCLSFDVDSRQIFQDVCDHDEKGLPKDLGELLSKIGAKEVEGPSGAKSFEIKGKGLKGIQDLLNKLKGLEDG